MYLNNSQKNIIENLSRTGEKALRHIINEMLIKQEAYLTYHLHKQVSGPPFNEFLYYFKTENQTEKFFFCFEEGCFGWASEELRNLYKLPDQATQEKKDITKLYFESQARHNQLAKPEVKNQQKFLSDLQDKVAEMLHTIELLLNNNLLIVFEKNIKLEEIFGIEIDTNTYWVEKIEINNSSYTNTSTLFLLLEKFFKSQIIILPGLELFVKHNFMTDLEIDNDNERKYRSLEIQNLEKQTRRLMYGIIFPAAITLVAAIISIFLSQPNSTDIKAITDSINQLTLKVDQLNPNPESPGPQGSGSQLIIPEDTFVPAQVTSLEFHKQEDL